MSDLNQIQLEKLNCLLAAVWNRNPFYTGKWREAGVAHGQIHSLDELKKFPFTIRNELLGDQNATPPLGTNLTFAISEYKRIHRSSGTTRTPLFWADTAASWRWVMRCSQALFLLAGVAPEDRIFFALNFGASSGPWIIYESACQFGGLCFTNGEADPKTQLDSLVRFAPTVLVASPNELFKLARLAKENRIDPAMFGIRKIISFGKDGWNFVAIRQHAREIWNAPAFNRYGMTEAGSIAGECEACPGAMHLLENEFIAEVIDPRTSQPVNDCDPGELVLTNLGRIGRPIIRYRTGDLVRLMRHHHCACGRKEALLLGGVTRDKLNVS